MERIDQLNNTYRLLKIDLKEVNNIISRLRLSRKNSIGKLRKVRRELCQEFERIQNELND